MCPSLGTAIAFAVYKYEDEHCGTPQPTIRSLKAVQDNLHWNINDFM
jgi:hypothetical protein